MGIDHDAMVWYGVQLPDKLPKMMREALALGEDDDAVEALDGYLVKPLGYVTWGCSLSGTGRGTGIVVGDTAHIGSRYRYVTDFAGEVPDCTELHRVLKLFGLKEKPGWHLSMSVY